MDGMCVCVHLCVTVSQKAPHFLLVSEKRFVCSDSVTFAQRAASKPLHRFRAIPDDFNFDFDTNFGIFMTFGDITLLSM